MVDTTMLILACGAILVILGYIRVRLNHQYDCYDTSNQPVAYLLLVIGLSSLLAVPVSEILAAASTDPVATAAIFIIGGTSLIDITVQRLLNPSLHHDLT